MRTELTHATEDYLKAVYELTTTHGRATTTQLAELLEVKPASVTGMVQRLASTDPPLLEYKKHKGVQLTQAGKEVALEVVRHHRLLEMYLHEKLGFSWDEVHEEADRLEHVISENFEERIAKALGDPSHDPHGDPIPTRDFKLPHSDAVPLSSLRTGHSGTVRRVRDTDPELLRYLGEHGVVPEAEIEVLDHTPFDDNLEVRVKGRDESVVLGLPITVQIYIDLEESKVTS
jgi:DtxR family Mn-dependent transcriptional regulator